jgi:hypothetical protein
MPTRDSFESALNSSETAVTSVFRRMSCWLMIRLHHIMPYLCN